MAEELLLSAEGYEKLKKELEQLKTEDRHRIAENIREAKSHGDLRENAMYHEAKLNQKRLESRIAELEKALQVAKIVDTENAVGASLGTTLKLQDEEWGDIFSVTLAGAYEADPDNGRISVTSPLGAALMGKKEGDEVEVDAPTGKQKYLIIDVE